MIAARRRRSLGSAVRPFVTLFVAELLQHAIAAINAEPHRLAGRRPTLARRLDRINVTIPPGMHEQEQGILRRRIESAVRLVWQAMGWTGAAHPIVPPVPTVTLVSDNATATMIAYLDNEITHKFRGRAEEYVALVGKPRTGLGGGRALRLATLDIGAASTGVAVATFEIKPGASLLCTRHLTDGFACGVDDVHKAIVERVVVPAIEQRLAECKLADPRRLLDIAAG